MTFLGFGRIRVTMGSPRSTFSKDILPTLIDNPSKKSKRTIDVDEKSLNGPDLAIGQYALPEGPVLVKFKLTIKNRENDDTKYSTNRFMVCTLRTKLVLEFVLHDYFLMILVQFGSEIRPPARGNRWRSGENGE